MDKLGRHMQTARQYFLNKDTKDAAGHVREGAAFLLAVLTYSIAGGQV